VYILHYVLVVHEFI